VKFTSTYILKSNDNPSQFGISNKKQSTLLTTVSLLENFVTKSRTLLNHFSNWRSSNLWFLRVITQN